MVKSNTDSYPPLREIINRYGLRAEKKFGQNFLLDLNITRKIISSLRDDAQGSHIIEIGPGPGGLTRAALEANPKSLNVIELDPRCIKALEIYGDKLNVTQGDALRQNLPELVPETPRVIVGNLPYNISTALLVKWLKDIYQNKGCYSHMVLMFQKEVAERIIAPPGNKTYGRLSILSQWLCDIQKVMTLPPQAFTPSPKVDSTVLRFTPKQEIIDAPFENVEYLTAKAFQARRKMLRQSLKEHKHVLEALNIDTTLRAENLDVATFIVCANRINLQKTS